MDISQAAFDYLSTTPWAPSSPAAVRFLAAGEYNANYLVECENDPVVLRINHGSQLGLGAGQIEYEFAALQALQHSGVTPRPYHVNPDAHGLGPVLVMEYLPGRALDYGTDLDTAARIFARVHAQPVSDALLVQADPVADIAAESLALLNRFPDHPRHRERDMLLAYHEQVVRLGEDTRMEFADEPLVLVNTEVNSGNFIMEEKGGQEENEVRGWLVDWEKAVVSHRYQDLGHFLVATTTLWKTDHRITNEDRTAFLFAYGEASGADLDMYALSRRTAILERTILLRALSWCYMAWYEYTSGSRALTNEYTMQRITWYLDEMECFLT